MRQLEKSLRREQRKLSKKLLKNTKSYTKNRKPIFEKPLKECKNIQKQNLKIKLIYKKLSNIRNNYLHQTTTGIVKTKPSRIVIEDLNISGMMKNKHLSKAISKMCSCCGNVKKDLKLSERVYKCSKCGNVIDRDYNASINLANYKLA